MIHTDYENRLMGEFQQENEATPPKRRLTHSLLNSPVSPISPSRSPRKPVHSDRLMPSRLGAKWQANFDLIRSDAFSRNEMKKVFGRDGGLEGGKDMQIYQGMVRNELLGTDISDSRQCPPAGGVLSATTGNSVTSANSSVANFLAHLHQPEPGMQEAERRINISTVPADRRVLYEIDPIRVFHYQSPRNQGTDAHSMFSLSPLSPSSQALLRSPRKTARKISKMPYKVLDAPELQDDFYLNLVDWSSQNVLAVGLGASVWLWFACTSQVTRLCDLSVESDSVTSVAWTEKGNLVAVGTHHGLVQIWDVAASKKINTISGHVARVGAIAWNGDNQICSGSRDRFIQMKDIRAPAVLPDRRLQGHRQEVCGLKWSPDNQYLASGGNDNKLHVWSLHSNSPVQTYSDHVAAVKAIAWSPHHHGLLASGGGTADKCIRFWNTLTGQGMQCVDTGSQVCNLAWSKHSSELVSTHGYSQNQILLWKYPSLVQVAKLTGHNLRVLYLAMSPCGESIVTGAGDETLRFWSVFSKARSPKQVRSVLDPFANLR